MRRAALPILLLLTACQRELALPKEPDPAPPVEPFDVDPPIAQAAPGEPVTMELVGGTAPFAFEPTAIALGGVEPEAAIVRRELDGGASAEIAGRTLSYKAPTDRGDFDQELPLVDAAGVEVTAKIHVGSPLRVTPSYAFANASGRVSISASGGKPPYTFQVVEAAPPRAEAPPNELLAARSTWLDDQGCGGAGGGTSGGSSGSSGSGGAGGAGGAGGGGDVSLSGGTLLLASTAGETTIRVTDALAAESDATIVRGDALRLLQERVQLRRGEAEYFSAVGGDPPYAWWITPMGEVPGEPIGEGGVVPAGLSWDRGTLTVADDFAFPSDGSDVVFEVWVEGWSWKAPCPTEDAPLRRVKTTLTIHPPDVVITDPLALDAPQRLGAGQTTRLSATGGVPPYLFSYADRGNFSGGSVDPDGTWRAGPNANLRDRLRVTDADGTSAELEVVVTASGVSSTSWAGGLTPQERSELRTHEAVGRTLFSAGLRFRLDEDGSPIARLGAPGQVLQVTDFNADGFADVLARLGAGADATIHLYVGTPDGDLVWVGGGLRAEGAAFVPTIEPFEQTTDVADIAGPTFVVLADGFTLDGTPCDLSVVSIAALVAATPPTSCQKAFDGGMEVDGPHVLPVGRNAFAFVRRGVEYFSLDASGVVSPRLSKAGVQFACPERGGDRFYGGPLAAELDGVPTEGLLDVVRLLDGPSGGVLQACLIGMSNGPQPAPIARAIEAGVVNAARQQVYVGGRRPGARDELLLGYDLTLGDGPILTYVLIDGLVDPMLDQPLGRELPNGRVVGTGDLDGDGFVDLLATDGFRALFLHRGDPDGGFGRSRRIRLGPVASYELIATHVDPDETADLVASTSGFLRILGGASVAADPFDPASPGQPSFATLAEASDASFMGLADVVDVDGDAAAELLTLDFSGVPHLLTTDAVTGALDGELALEAQFDETWGRPRAAILQAGGPRALVVPRVVARDELEALRIFALDPVDTTVRLVREVPLGVSSGDADHLLLLDLDRDGVTDLVTGSTCTAPCGENRVDGVFFWKGLLDADGWALEQTPVLLADAVDTQIRGALLSRPRLFPDPSGAFVVRVWGVTTEGTPGQHLWMDVVDAVEPFVSLSGTVDLGALEVRADSAWIELQDLDGDGTAELVVGASTVRGQPTNVVAVVHRDGDGRPVGGSLTCTVLAPAGVDAEFRVLDVLGDGVPELAVVLQPPGQSALSEVVLLNSGGIGLSLETDPFGCHGQPFRP